MRGRGRPVTSTSCERLKLPGTLRGSLWLYFFCFPESDCGSGWIAENAHLAVAHDLADINDDFRSEGFCLGGGGFYVVDADVGEPHGGRAGHGVLHHAADWVIAVLDEGVVHVHAGYVFELPVEEL